VWARVRGGDEQVAEAAFSAALVGDLVGQLAGDAMPIGGRAGGALARGSIRTPAARSERLVNGGLAYLADHNRPDALKHLTLATIVDRRAGNLFSWRRSAHFLSRAYEDADEFYEALRFCRGALIPLSTGDHAAQATSAPAKEPTSGIEPETSGLQNRCSTS
jgi:hypothetical protein